MFDVTPICDARTFKPNEVFEDRVCLGMRDFRSGLCSLQALTEADVHVSIQYSNRPELGWFDHIEFDIPGGAPFFRNVDFPPCRWAKFTVTNKANAKNLVHIIPCYV